MLILEPHIRECIKTFSEEDKENKLVFFYHDVPLTSHYLYPFIKGFEFISGSETVKFKKTCSWNYRKGESNAAIKLPSLKDKDDYGDVILSTTEKILTEDYNKVEGTITSILDTKHNVSHSYYFNYLFNLMARVLIKQEKYTELHEYVVKYFNPNKQNSQMVKDEKRRISKAETKDYTEDNNLKEVLVPKYGAGGPKGVAEDEELERASVVLEDKPEEKKKLAKVVKERHIALEKKKIDRMKKNVPTIQTCKSLGLTHAYTMINFGISKLYLTISNQMPKKETKDLKMDKVEVHSNQSVYPNITFLEAKACFYKANELFLTKEALLNLSVVEHFHQNNNYKEVFQNLANLIKGYNVQKLMGLLIEMRSLSGKFEALSLYYSSVLPPAYEIKKDYVADLIEFIIMTNKEDRNFLINFTYAFENNRRLFAKLIIMLTEIETNGQKSIEQYKFINNNNEYQDEESELESKDNSEGQLTEMEERIKSQFEKENNDDVPLNSPYSVMKQIYKCSVFNDCHQLHEVSLKSVEVADKKLSKYTNEKECLVLRRFGDYNSAQKCFRNSNLSQDDFNANGAITHMYLGQYDKAERFLIVSEQKEPTKMTNPRVKYLLGFIKLFEAMQTGAAFDPILFSQAVEIDRFDSYAKFYKWLVDYHYVTKSDKASVQDVLNLINDNFLKGIIHLIKSLSKVDAPEVKVTDQMHSSHSDPNVPTTTQSKTDFRRLRTGGRTGRIGESLPSLAEVEPKKDSIGSTFEVALAHFTYALKNDPLDPTCQFYKGFTEYMLGHYDTALKSLDIANTLNPNHVYTYLFKAFIHEQKNNKQQAFDDFTMAIKLSESTATGYYGPTITYEKHDTYHVLEDYIMALIGGKTRLHHSRIGLALYKLTFNSTSGNAKYGLVVNEFKEALANNNPASLVYYNNLARYRLNEQKFNNKLEVIANDLEGEGHRVSPKFKKSRGVNFSRSNSNFTKSGRQSQSNLPPSMGSTSAQVLKVLVEEPTVTENLADMSYEDESTPSADIDLLKAKSDFQSKNFGETLNILDSLDMRYTRFTEYDKAITTQEDKDMLEMLANDRPNLSNDIGKRFYNDILLLGDISLNEKDYIPNHLEILHNPEIVMQRKLAYEIHLLKAKCYYHLKNYERAYGYIKSITRHYLSILRILAISTAKAPPVTVDIKVDPSAFDHNSSARKVLEYFNLAEIYHYLTNIKLGDDLTTEMLFQAISGDMDKPKKHLMKFLFYENAIENLKLRKFSDALFDLNNYYFLDKRDSSYTESLHNQLLEILKTIPVDQYQNFIPVKFELESLIKFEPDTKVVSFENSQQTDTINPVISNTDQKPLQAKRKKASLNNKPKVYIDGNSTNKRQKTRDLPQTDSART
jgi:tetratricopeptide (TPR) repeat protein